MQQQQYAKSNSIVLLSILLCYGLKNTVFENHFTCANTDPYVKIYLLYNDQRIAKKKTHVKKRTLNPVFNESFVFELPHLEEGLKNISLEFMLLDWDRVTKNEVRCWQKIPILIQHSSPGVPTFRFQNNPQKEDHNITCWLLP